MDGSTVEHSDSDSGDSWTLLESIPTFVDIPDLAENSAIPSERETVEALSEKDEDTDGISIISDSEPESMPCDVSYIKVSTEESHPAEERSTPVLVPPPPTNINLNNRSIEDEPDFLGDKAKYRTYVHRRNPKVGTILDIIMLGTFVITAGMALGHLWSCKNECTPQTSVNKILSNLYKLQEENVFLRNKLKEITMATGNQLPQQQTMVDNNLALKQHRCKKVFEEPIMKNIKAELAVKCVYDNKPDIILQDSLALPEHEKEFLSDIGKMKDIYDHNKNWLDEKIKIQFEEFKKPNSGLAKSRSNIEVEPQHDLHKQLGPTFIPLNTHPDILHDKTDSSKVKSHIQSHTGKQSGLKHFDIPLDTHDAKDSKTESSNSDKSQGHVHLEMEHPVTQNTNLPNPNVKPDPFEMLEKKISYADSLKTDQPLLRSQRSVNNDKPGRWIKDHVSKRKHKEDDILLNLNSFSEDDIKKDDRYTGPKMKHEKKKHDRQKSNKKQKRNNKYEQWEMKGGYLKDFDEFSISSSQDNDMLINKPDKKFINPDFENYINKFIEIENNTSSKDTSRNTKKLDEKSKKIGKRSLKDEKRKKGEVKDADWYNERSALRAEARMKLERELFGENDSNNAGWYFRRMQRREQCRTLKGNSTFKKFSKRKMNFKMKR